MVSFLMVGHTHNDADQQFVPLTYELRKSVIKSLSDYLAVGNRTGYMPAAGNRLSNRCRLTDRSTGSVPVYFSVYCEYTGIPESSHCGEESW